MTKNNETLLYIEKEDVAEAEFMSRNFVQEETKKRAYINALGAELVKKYLSSNGVDADSTKNLHSISKILEKYDIADILLPKLHIDVRVIFDENKIFVPKSHFENDLIPDLYAVVKFDNEFKAFEFIGYFKPSQIDKKRKNSLYYFIEKSELLPVDDFIDDVKNFNSGYKNEITEEEMLFGRELSVALNDHDISAKDEKHLLKLLLQSEALRESVLEFDNFETLAYNASSAVLKITGQNAEIAENLPVAEEIVQDLSESTSISDEVVDDVPAEDEIQPVQEEIAEKEENFDSLSEYDLSESMLSDDNSIDDETGENVVKSNETELSEVDSAQKEELFVDESELMLEDGVSAIDEELPAQEPLADEPVQDLALKDENIKLPQEPVISSETASAEPIADKNLSVDDILDRTINSIDEPKKNQKSDIADKIISGIVTAAETTGVAAAGLAASAAAAQISQAQAAEKIADIAEAAIPDIKQDDSDKADEKTEIPAENSENVFVSEENLPPQMDISEGSAASDDAIKLTSVSGDLLDEVLNENLEKQSKNLDRIDYKKTDIAPDVKEIPTNMTITDNFAASQIIQNAETEASGQFESPKDIDSMNKVKEYKDDTVFVQETVDMSSMETVKNDLYIEGNADGTYDMENLTSLSPEVTPEEKFLEVHIQSEAEVVDLPNMESSFTIDADGNSNIDSAGLNNGYDPTLGDENLVDIGFETSGNYPSSVEVDGMENFDTPISEDDYVLSGEDDLEKQSKEIVDTSVADTYTISEDVSYDETDLSDLLDEFPISDETSSEQQAENQEIVSDFENSSVSEPVAENLSENVLTDDVLKGEEVLQSDDVLQGDELLQGGELPEITDSLSTLEDLPELDMPEQLSEPEQVLEEPVQDSTELTDEPDLMPLSEENISLENADVSLDEISENTISEMDMPMMEQTLDTAEAEPSIEDLEKNIDKAIESELLDGDNNEQSELFNEESGDVFAENQEETVSPDLPAEDVILTEDTTVADAPEVVAAPADDDILSADEFFAQDEVLRESEQNESDISGAADNSGNEWLSDDAAEQNSEVNAAQAPIVEEDIVEPSAVGGSNVVENSVVISDKTFSVGEIRIDINNQPQSQFANGEPLSELYNQTSNTSGREMLDNPGTVGAAQHKSGIAGKFLGTVVVLAIFGAIGFGAAKFFKAPSEEAPNPVTDETVPAQPATANANTPNVNPDNVVAMDNNTDALVQKPVSAPQTTSTSQPAKTPIIEIKKLTWEVPDYVSYNQDFKQYFQSAGRSLKAAISSDLLLATDNLYQNQLKVSVTFTKDGTFKNAQIVTSCGSSQIDGIVLQTVNQTLKALKAPNSVNNDESTTAILKLYF